jgi:hypothetical protein
MGLAFALVYLTGVLIASGDVWERAGAGGVLGGLFVAWTAISIVVAATLIVRDLRAVLVGLACSPGVGRQDQGLSRLERSGRVDSVRVQFGDLVGPARVSQTISGDTAESFVGPDQVKRPSTAPVGAHHAAP